MADVLVVLALLIGFALFALRARKRRQASGGDLSIDASDGGGGDGGGGD